MSDKVIGSKRFRVNVSDVLEVVKNGALVATAAFLTYVVQNVGSIDMGENLLLVVPMLTMGLNAVLSWVQDKTK